MSMVRGQRYRAPAAALLVLMCTNASGSTIMLGTPAKFPVNKDGVPQAYSENVEFCTKKPGDPGYPASCHSVPLTVTPGDDASTKASNLVKAIQGDPTLKGLGIRAIANGDLGHEGEVDLIGPIADIHSVTPNESFKGVALGSIVPSDGGVFAGGTTGTISFTGTLTGLAVDGSEPSSFAASFGFDSTVTSVSLTSADLANLTLNELLTTLFTDLSADLPAQYRPDLALDLSGDSLSFAFPEGAGDPFVAGFSDDAGLSPSFALDGIPPVPEPSSLELLGLGIAALSMLRRQLPAKDRP